METNKQLTGVEWQHIELSKFLSGKSEFTDAHDILIKAKEMEREMERERMIKFGCLLTFAPKHIVEEAYKETYGGGDK